MTHVTCRLSRTGISSGTLRSSMSMGISFSYRPTRGLWHGRLRVLHGERILKIDSELTESAPSVWWTWSISGVTSHRQPRQCRGAQGSKTVKGAQSNPNYVSRLLLDCVLNVCRGPKNYSYTTVVNIVGLQVVIRYDIKNWRQRYKESSEWINSSSWKACAWN